MAIGVTFVTTPRQMLRFGERRGALARGGSAPAAAGPGRLVVDACRLDRVAHLVGFAPEAEALAKVAEHGKL